MKSFAVILTALVAAATARPSLANSQPDFDNIAAGEPFTIRWFGAEGPVSLELRYGDSDNLLPLVPIASGQTSNEDGEGEFTWTVPTELPEAGDYAIQINDASGEPNYSVPFAIDGIVVEASSTTVTTPTTAVTSVTSVSVSVSVSTDTEVSTTSEAPASASSDAPTETESDGPSPTDNDDEPDHAASLGSPLAMILFSVAAMLYFF